MDISNLSIAELKTLRADIDAALKARSNDEIAKARQQIAQIAKEAGLSLKDLIAGAAKSGAVKSVAVKFRDPTDATKEWTGRGRAPKWAAAMKAAGTFDSARV